jgi:hypothetical protein
MQKRKMVTVQVVKTRLRRPKRELKAEEEGSADPRSRKGETRQERETHRM